MKINLLSILILLSSLTFGQKKEDLVSVHAANTKAVFLGKVSPKLNTFKKTPLSERNKKRQDKQLPPNFIGRGKSNVILPELEHQGVDPLRQLKMPQNANAIIEPLVNTDGLFNSFGSPHDPTGSIGTNHYVQAINATVIGVFDKSGNKVTDFAANDLWEPLGESSLGDPIVLFDHESNQWIITEFADPALLLIAVSETDDPTGNYSVYSFATPSFPDYPKYAIWSDYIIVTTNEVGPGSLHQYFIDRPALMSGADDVTIQRVEIAGNTSTEAGFYITTPVHWNGSVEPVDNKPIAVKINDSSWGEVSADALEVFSFDVDLNDPSNTTVEKITLETTPFDSYPCDNESGGFACVSQGGEGSGGLDAIPEVVMNIPHYRNFETHESIVLNFITDVTDGENLSGIRWMELRRTDGNDWSIYQEGTFAPDDGLHRYMGSIGIDEKGNIGMAYNVSSATEFAGIRFTGRFASDPLGQMTVEEYVAVTGTNFIDTDRFGDYPHITVDPLDGQTFWYTAEYGGNGVDNSKTRLLAFQLEKKDNDIAVIGINSPSTGADLTDSEQVVTDIINNGNLSATGFDIILSLDGSEIETFTYSETLNSGASYEHTFSNTLDLSMVGEYDITVSLSYAGDESTGNDTRTKKVSNQAQLDGELILNVESSTCNENYHGTIQLTNNGVEVITSAQVELFVNGTSTSIVNYSGSLSTGEKDIIETQFEGLINGPNDLSVSILTLNNETDVITDNNISNATVNLDATLEQVTFTLITDEYPEETTWQIANESDEVVLSGGPYGAAETTFVENFCLPKDQCYVFTIFDTASDGICCDFGQGSFTLSDAAGNSIFESAGDFGASQEALICLGNGSFPTVDAAVSLVADDLSACLSEFPTIIAISNKGADPLTTLSIELSLNGTIFETIEWSGNLSFGEISEEEMNLGTLESGENTISIEAKSPNGTTDEDTSNNTDEATVDNTDDLMTVLVSIKTDEFPEETRWGIEDENEELLILRGPYTQENTTITELICLPDESCYNFIIVDSFGDGIENGAYSLTDGFGEVLFSGTGGFGEIAEEEFCLEAAGACKLTVSVESINIENGSNGSIIISASGGINFQYSIDGGVTFHDVNVFDDLTDGSYDVVVKTTGDCKYEETVIISKVLGIEDNILSVSPNPTKGLFQIRLISESGKNEFLEAEIMDIKGRIIQTRKFSRYANEFVGTVSLVAYPEGVYILRLSNSTESVVTRVIKE